MKKRILACLLMGLGTMASMAQISNTLSPYSQFALGTLANQSQGFNRGMDGLGYGLRDSRQVNILNPASYSAIDSLTMIFDMGVSGQFTSFKEGGRRVNAKTADFDYAIGMFRLLPKVGASFGIVPYSNIGYNYYEAEWIGSAEGDYYGSTSNNYYNNYYKGDGGFNQAFIGLGWEMFKGVSIGANISYFWGKYNKTVSNAFSDTNVNTITKTYSTEVNTWKLDLGAQWTTKISRKNRLTIGAVATIGHKLGADADLSIVNTNTSTGVTYTTTDSVANGLSIPYSFGGGVSLVHNNSLTVGADYLLQKWGTLEYPVVNETNDKYLATRGYYKDRHKVTVGLDWVPNPTPQARRFLSRVHYKLGASYATPYYNIGTKEGPREISVSAGFAIPIMNNWNSRSTINISAQWVNTTAKNLINENSFRINIGFTFNERWFAKWKVD
jgi:hypothetical protein